MNCCRFSFRCDLSARAAPWTRSIRVTTEIAISVFPALPEMAASICRAFCPSRSAVISTLESQITLDHDFRTRAHPCQQLTAAGSLPIIRLFPVFRFCL